MVIIIIIVLQNLTDIHGPDIRKNLPNCVKLKSFLNPFKKTLKQLLLKNALNNTVFYLLCYGCEVISKTFFNFTSIIC